MSKTRVLIAEQMGIVRTGLRLLLDALPDVAVVGEAADGAEAVDMAVRLLPDVLIIEVSRPGCQGLEAIRALRRSAPSVHTLALTSGNEDYLVPALEAGAAGYLPKEADPQELHLAIRAIVRGHLFLSPFVMQTVVSGYLRSRREDRLAGDRHQMLTIREREVLQLAAQGRTNREMAGALRLSIKTIEKHRSNLMAKLTLRDRKELVLYAAQYGLTNALT